MGSYCWIPDSTMNSDLFYMEKVLELGEKVRGTTGDNPWVGCVIVKNSQIIGIGVTHPPGDSHAIIGSSKIVSSLFGPVEIICTGQPTRSWIRLT